jgi:hypothetical protein
MKNNNNKITASWQLRLSVVVRQPVKSAAMEEAQSVWERVLLLIFGM